MTQEKQPPAAGDGGRRSGACDSAHKDKAQLQHSDVAPPAQWDEHVVATIVKNSREEIRVSLAVFHGRPIINVRTWWSGADGVMRPGKGLACRIDLVPDLAAGLAEAERQAREQGLLS